MTLTVRSVSKKQSNKYVKKVYKFLDNNHKIEIKKLKGERGAIEVHYYPKIKKYAKNYKSKLEVNPDDYLMSTLIHETLHYYYPNKSEEWVLKMERDIVNQLSDRQLKNLLKKFAQKI